MPKIQSEFAEFLSKYDIAALAVAFIMGKAANDFITKTVNSVFMPIVGAFLPGEEWRQFVVSIGAANIEVGNFIAAALDFMLIAIAVFLFIKYWPYKKEKGEKSEKGKEKKKK